MKEPMGGPDKERPACRSCNTMLPTTAWFCFACGESQAPSLDGIPEETPDYHRFTVALAWLDNEVECKRHRWRKLAEIAALLRSALASRSLPGALKEEKDNG